MYQYKHCLSIATNIASNANTISRAMMFFNKHCASKLAKTYPALRYICFLNYSENWLHILAEAIMLNEKPETFTLKINTAASEKEFEAGETADGVAVYWISHTLRR